MLGHWLLKKGSYRVLILLVIISILSICIGVTLFITQTI